MWSISTEIFKMRNQPPAKSHNAFQICPKMFSNKISEEQSEMMESSSLALPESTRPPTITRRKIAGNFRLVFDHLRQVFSVTVRPKTVFQKTWDGYLEWEDDVGAHIAHQFEDLIDSSGFFVFSGCTSILGPGQLSVSRSLSLLQCIGDALWSSYLCQNNIRRRNPHFFSICQVTTCTKEDIIPKFGLRSKVLGCRLLKYLSKLSTKASSTALPKFNRYYQPTGGNRLQLSQTQPIK